MIFCTEKHACPPNAEERLPLTSLEYSASPLGVMRRFAKRHLSRLTGGRAAGTFGQLPLQLRQVEL